VSVTAARGFVAGGLASGIKPSGDPDLAIVAVEPRRPVPAAGVFTTNLATAAPVQVSRAHLGDGHAAAVVLNSGNANAATGEPGRTDARRMCALTGEAVGAAETDVLVCSTGLIGYRLPMLPLETGIPKLGRILEPTAEAGTTFADALLTTDTVRKEAVARVDGSDATVGGAAKGAAMLAPSMATMLAVITTDAAIGPAVLQEALHAAVSRSFDAIVVDGCRSTNDTVLVLANGAAGTDPIDRPEGPAYHAFSDALAAVCRSLAEQMVRDAEGATKLARLTIRGARSTADAKAAARQVASSQLVQCSLYGEDPYWGRILSELGASGAHLDAERVDIAYGGYTVCRDGVACAHDAGAVAAVMAARELDLECDLHQGTATAEILFSDLTHAYIDENRATS
jgi:glutamate N-acetyltransferase/amino-acid N-acetyltransferase